MKHGFSIPEMVVVTAVIIVIAAIAIPNIGELKTAETRRKEQETAARRAQIELIKEAIREYENEKQSVHTD